MIREPTPIPLDELPARLRALSNDLTLVGAAIRYYGGFGPFGEWGDLMENQTAPMCREVA